jgi:hypothetical protein
MGGGGQRHAFDTLPPGKRPVPIVQEGWAASGPVWTDLQVCQFIMNKKVVTLKKSPVTHRLVLIRLVIRSRLLVILLKCFRFVGALIANAIKPYANIQCYVAQELMLLRNAAPCTVIFMLLNTSRKFLTSDACL